MTPKSNSGGEGFSQRTEGEGNGIDKRIGTPLKSYDDNGK